MTMPIIAMESTIYGKSRTISAAQCRSTPALTRCDGLVSASPMHLKERHFIQPVVDPVAIEGDMALGQATLRFVDQPHGGITSLGIRVDEGARSCGYAIDFHDLLTDMAILYRGLDVWICDCLRRTPHPTHAHLDAVLGWARELKVGQLLLTHLDKSMDYATLAAELPDWAAPAFDGQEIDFG